MSDYGKGVCDLELLRNIIDLSNKFKIPVFADPRRKIKILIFIEIVFVLRLI